MKKIIFAVISLLIAIGSQGQDTKKFLKEGNNHLEYERYRKASSSYLLVLKDEPENSEALFNLGKAYLGSYRHPEGLELMEKALTIKTDIDKHQEYWLGRAYHLNYKFNKAIKHYNNYLAVIPKNDPRKKDIDKFIYECENAKEFVGKRSFYRIDNIGAPINTAIDEHSPILTQDGNTMMVTTVKHKEDGENKSDNYSENVLIYVRDESGKWKKPQQLNHKLTGHEATVQLYDNDTKLLLYRNTGAGDLYQSELIDSVWSEPVPITSINTAWPEIDAYVNKEGDKMIYSSNFKSTNYANSDLFVVTKTANGWSQPKSLGSNINTEYDETSPFISSDGKTLFFSSTGHNSMGGFDVFKSFYDDSTGTWSKPINLGYPLNTPSDDVYFYYSNEDNWSGYFSSYRRGGLGEKDIYKVQFTPNVFITGVVKDKATQKPLPNLNIKFIAEGEEEDMGVDVTKQNSGKYLVNLLADRSYSVIIQDKSGQTLGTFEYIVPLLKEKDPLDYVFDIELNVDAPELISENVTSAAHEDEEIVSIDASEEVVTNKELPKNVVVKEEVDFAALSTMETLTNEVDALDETPSEEKIKEENPTEKAVKEAKNHFKMDDVETGCKRVLHHVYFSFNKAVLQEKSFDELDKLACLMSSKSDSKVEIGGYTDNVGDDAYNKQLSQKRAQAVVDYLVKQGIPKSRLTAVGYGEEHPIASNDDEDEGRELNRRTEFKFLK